MIGNRRDDVVVRVSDSQSIDLRFISQVESYQKTLRTLKSLIHLLKELRSAAPKQNCFLCIIACYDIQNGGSFCFLFKLFDPQK